MGKSNEGGWRVLLWIVRIYMWVVIIWAVSSWLPFPLGPIGTLLTWLTYPIWKCFGFVSVGMVNLSGVIAVVVLILLEGWLARRSAEPPA
jgi:uncharacterized protein YggT (Ycf19 family)